MSTRNPFSQDKHCPVVEHWVKLSAVRVSLPSGQTDTARKSCSNIEACLLENGPIELNTKCLLHGLK